MKALIRRVKDVFQITGRGCVIVPGFAADADLRGRVGATLLLKRPDGSEITSTIRGFEFSGNPSVLERTGYAILLADVTRADEVPHLELPDLELPSLEVPLLVACATDSHEKARNDP